jgi:hypothetical protein
LWTKIRAKIHILYSQSNLDLNGLDFHGVADVLDKVGRVLRQQDEDRDQREDEHVSRVQLLAQ